LTIEERNVSQSKQQRKKNQSRRSSWPLFLIVGGVLLVAGVIAASLLGGSSPSDDAAGSGAPALSITAIDKSPEAQVDGLKIDFGSMQLGAELATLRLTLKNTGDGALQFSEAPYIQLADGC
jgi:hypothetical protein